MSTVLDLVVPVLAGLFLLGALIFLLRGLASRRSVSTHDYGVARQEARKAMAVAFTRGIIMLITPGGDDRRRAGDPWHGPRHPADAADAD